MINLKEKLAEVEMNIRQAEANMYAMQGAKQILQQLIAAEEGGEGECSKSATAEV